MSNVIKIKGSGTASSVPSSLEYRELALNYADKKLYFKDSNGVIDYFDASAGGVTDSTLNDTVVHGVFPTGDYGDFGVGTIDAFGIRTNFKTYECMGGVGYLRQIDLGAL